MIRTIVLGICFSIISCGSESKSPLPEIKHNEIFDPKTQNSPAIKSYSIFLQDSVSRIDFYSWCETFEQIIEPKEGVAKNCTTVIDVGAESVMKRENLVASFTGKDSLALFAAEFSPAKIIKADLDPDVPIDARMVMLVAYKNHTYDTLVINGSGRLVLNHSYILHYADFKKSLKNIFKPN